MPKVSIKIRQLVHVVPRQFQTAINVGNWGLHVNPLRRHRLTTLLTISLPILFGGIERKALRSFLVCIVRRAELHEATYGSNVSLVILLRRLGFTCETVSNGRSAFSFLFLAKIGFAPSSLLFQSRRPALPQLHLLSIERIPTSLASGLRLGHCFRHKQSK